MKNRLQGVRSWLFSAIFVASATHASPSIPQPLLDNSVIYCTHAQGFSFNPQRAEAGSNMNVVAEQIFDKLVEFNPRTQQILPALAERFDVSEDGLTVTFQLRKNVPFHHTKWFTPTRQLNADDVVFSLNRMMGRDDEISEDLAEQESLQRYQVNKEIADGTYFPYLNSIRLKHRIAHISATGSHQVTIRLNALYPDLFAHLASQYAVILSKEYALLLNADENSRQFDQLPVGTGVYQLDSYLQNDHIRLKPNPNYWRKKAKMANMIIDFSTSATGRTAKFLNNECDVVAFPELNQLAVMKNHGSIRKNAGMNLAFLAFNLQRPQMQNLALRQQIAQGINRARLVRTLFYGSARMANTVLPTGLLLNANQNGYPYFPRPFHKNSAKLTPLNLWVVDEKRVYNPHPLKMAELIRFDLARLGIPIQIRQVSQGYLVQQLEKNEADYDLILGGWLANNHDLDSFLYPILSCKVQQSVTNLANWCNAEFDELLNQAQASRDGAEKLALYQQAEALLQKNVPILPLVNADRLLVVSDKLKNVAISPFGQVNLAEIERKTEKSQ
ncbi:MAG: ABC transporter substrate-binding protein [Pasteurellaceae bacterium]|nr:ABC transporter substrate-binding protein [Pasteurellaceae bacterium]